MDKPVILVDLDTTVVDLWSGVNARRRMAGKRPVAPPRIWDMADFSKEDRDYCEAHFTNPIFYAGLEPNAGAIIDLWWLDKYYNIVYITGRAWNAAGFVPAEIDRATVQWLYRWQAPAGQVLYCATTDKGRMARQMYGDRIAFAIDDSPVCAKSLAAEGIFTFLIDMPYNQDLNHAAFARVRTLGDVIDILIAEQKIDAPLRNATRRG